jgi:isocitrate dehydrogenase
MTIWTIAYNSMTNGITMVWQFLTIEGKRNILKTIEQQFSDNFKQLIANVWQFSSNLVILCKFYNNLLWFLVKYNNVKEKEIEVS